MVDSHVLATILFGLFAQCIACPTFQAPETHFTTNPPPFTTQSSVVSVNWQSAVYDGPTRVEVRKGTVINEVASVSALNNNVRSFSKTIGSPQSFPDGNDYNINLVNSVPGVTLANFLVGTGIPTGGFITQCGQLGGSDYLIGLRSSVRQVGLTTRFGNVFMAPSGCQADQLLLAANLDVQVEGAINSLDKIEVIAQKVGKAGHPTSTFTPDAASSTILFSSTRRIDCHTSVPVSCSTDPAAFFHDSYNAAFGVTPVGGLTRCQTYLAGTLDAPGDTYRLELKISKGASSLSVVIYNILVDPTTFTPGSSSFDLRLLDALDRSIPLDSQFIVQTQSTQFIVDQTPPTIESVLSGLVVSSHPESPLSHFLDSTGSSTPLLVANDNFGVDSINCVGANPTKTPNPPGVTLNDYSGLDFPNRQYGAIMPYAPASQGATASFLRRRYLSFKCSVTDKVGLVSSTFNYVNVVFDDTLPVCGVSSTTSSGSVKTVTFRARSPIARFPKSGWRTCTRTGTSTDPLPTPVPNKGGADVLATLAIPADDASTYTCLVFNRAGVSATCTYPPAA